MAKFYTKDGWLTRYALACGYKHAQERKDRQEVVLTCICTETPLYLVRRYNGPERTLESFTQSLAFARQQFRLAMGEPLQRRYESNSDVARDVIA
jgi:hypothetical protein